jgi:hypothetical protein
MITLPHYNWFFQIQEGKPVTNVYTGSSGTEPSTGCFSITTFDYSVRVDTTVIKKKDADGNETDEQEPFKIVASWRFTYPFGHDPKFSEPVTEYFENSPEGLALAAKWLEVAEGREPEEL